MTRTTPPRPVDVEAVLPALSAHRRTATRLHPRHGVAKAEENSLAGPLLWPADEPWPVCTAVHPKGTGHRLDDVRLKRRILAEARGRDFSDEERRTLDAIAPGRHAPDLRDEDPLPLLAVAQLYARDIPDLVGPEGHDLLQVFWCPFEAHGPDRTIDVVLKWRRSHEVGDVLPNQPEPPVAGREACVPTRCVLHPEQVVEHEYQGLLSEELQDALADREEGLLDEEEDDEDTDDSSEPRSYDTYEEYEAAMARARAEEEYEVTYMGDLSIAPGWKVGGFASWHLTDPSPVDCAVCATPMPPLLTVDKWECDGGSGSWLPLEDRDSTDDPDVIDPVGVHLGRGLMRIHTCPTDPKHPHRLSFQ
ncbi:MULTISPECIES: hypothetical protein [Streptomyces]|uniref:LigA protein n=1 Tax=Streptomyces viridochromogenes TaxID=1938 RepID=A0A0L8L4D8_STRVR|nr:MULTISPECIES: hypothetical protein [Streptomyces]KOG33012.1 LigA protein [Streptomyces viridochromogenes]